jgi:hypothetical protein
VTSENVTVETRFGLLKPANLTPILKCVPLGSAQSELEGTTQREARDAWLNREGITWWPGADSEPTD